MPIRISPLLILLLFLALVGCSETRRPTRRPRLTVTPTMTTSPTPKPVVTRTPTAVPTSTERPPTETPTPTITPTPLIPDPFTVQEERCWISYRPSGYDPNATGGPDSASIRADLDLLKAAGVDGIVTDRADTKTGLPVITLAAQSAQWVIVGVRDPLNAEEMQNAVSTAQQPSVLGYVVGEQGLGVRYSFEELAEAIQKLRSATGKPVTTTEDWPRYQEDPRLLEVGDWIFPAVRPDEVNFSTPADAVDFTARTYDLFTGLAAGHPVILRQVGLPGVIGEDSAQVQADYYRGLNSSRALFVYDEAFDQPWIGEPGGGLGFYDSRRAPKPAARGLCKTGVMIQATAQSPFAVYTDAGAPDNHFTPSGPLGDSTDFILEPDWSTNPHSGQTALQVTYKRLGVGPFNCNVTAPPCRFTGEYWLVPPGNLGTVPNAGYDLSMYNYLSFWARSDNPLVIEFGMGGISGKFPDSASANPPKATFKLTKEWKQYVINLRKCGSRNCGPLDYVIGGFYFSIDLNQKAPPGPVIFYLDDIQYGQ